MTEKLLMVNLQDDQAKALAQIIANKTSRKILDILSNKDATESELAKELKTPMSTIHYNLKQLKKAGLVISEEYHYSKKGKEVQHYKLANKHIIISPKNSPGFMDKIKSIFPAFILSIAGAGAIHYFMQPARIIATESAVQKSAGADMAFSEAAPAAAQAMPAEPNLALWFLAGSLFVTLIVFITLLWRKK